MHVRAISDNRLTTKVRRLPPASLPPLAPSQPPPIYGLDIAEDGVLRIMDNVQASNPKTRRFLPPLSARMQRLTGVGRGPTTSQRNSPIGHLYKGSTNTRVKSARVNGSSPAYDMVVTGQTLVNGNGGYGSTSHGYSTSRWDDHSPSFIETEQELISNYLNANRHYLDRFVMQYVSEDELEQWLQQKRSRNNGTEADCLRTREKTGEDENPKAMEEIKYKKLIKDLTSDVKHLTSVGKLLQHLAAYVATEINCDDFSVYLFDEQKQEFCLYREANNVSKSCSDLDNGTDPLWPTEDTGCLQSSQVSSSPGGLGLFSKPCNILSLPVVDLSDRIIGTVQLYRVAESKGFTEDDKRVCGNLIGMSGLLLKCQEFYLDMGKQRQLNEFLLTVTKSIFQDIVSMDNVIIKIMTYALSWLQADRASLFLLDQRQRELFARIFDVGIATEVEKLAAEPVDIRTDEIYARVFDRGHEEHLEVRAGSDASPTKHPNEIRFSTNKGVAGYVAATGQTLNITDAYADERFNREIDLLTGYKTKTILCMPLCIRGKTIGVVQMVNKLNGLFTKRDEEAFEMFAVYCALALHHAKLYEKIRRSEQRNKVALEVLSYHSQATDEEANQLMKTPIPKQINELSDYSFSPWEIPGDDKPLYVLYMFRDLFQNARFDLSKVVRFTLTVRKNYRNVPYHNWTHAFSVAQTMYMIMKNAKTQFTLLEGLSLFVACLCHDVDHRGFTNQFMVNTSSPLASLYSTSTMEHHHFNHTITILQQEGHNIFTHLTSEDYKQVLGDIKQFILATDLAIFFSNKGRLKEITAKEPFSWTSKEHRQLGFAISMTACDLCSSSKPWDIQIGVVQVIFEEFYAQGDKEKAAGKTPMTMMDRDRKDQLPVLQSGFLTGICVPCYEILADILPETKPMLEGTRANLKIWQADAEKEKEKEEERAKQEKKEQEQKELTRDESGKTAEAVSA